MGPCLRGRGGRRHPAHLAHLALSPEDYDRLWTQLGAYLQAAGREAASLTGGVYTFAAIGASREEAQALLAPSIEAIFHAPFETFAPLCLFGTADDWLEQIGRFTDAGARHVNVLLSTQDLLGDVQRLGEEVVARLSRPGVGPLGTPVA
jgi:alkanesulfonate monooxygenase SsuD/methylene tetrahydromethanopterin reductase-like flavin-dependent oxidoreductase (luciferase family)